MLLWLQQGRQYILPEQEDIQPTEEGDDDEEEEQFSQIVYEEKYHNDREHDFLNGKVIMMTMNKMMFACPRDVGALHRPTRILDPRNFREN